MKPTIPRGIWPLLCCLSMLLPSLLGSQRAGAQPTVPTPAQAALARTVEVHLAHASFIDALQALREKTGLSLIADGTPDEESVRPDLNVSGPAREAIERVARAYDYGWWVSKGGIVLLHKRFSRPESLPQIIEAEWLHAAQDLLTVMSRAPMDRSARGTVLDRTAVMRSVGASLTPAQRQALAEGRTLRGADLAPEQVDLLQTALLTTLFGAPHREAALLAERLKVVAKCRLRADRLPVDVSGPDFARSYTLWLVPGGPDAGPRGLLLDNAIPTDTSTWETGDRAATDDDAARGQGVSEGHNGAAGASAVGFDTPIRPVTGQTTLAALAAALSDQVGVRVDPASYLGERRLTVATGGISARRVLDGLCELEDLTWYKASERAYLVARHTARVGQDPVEVHQRMLGALPRDMRVYLGTELLPGDPLPEGLMGDGSRASAMARLSGERILRTVGRVLERDGEMPCRGLPARARRGLAGMLVARLFRNVFWVWLEAPPTSKVPPPWDMRHARPVLRMQESNLRASWVDDQGQERTVLSVALSDAPPEPPGP